MINAPIDITFVVPCLNEEARVTQSLTSIVTACQRLTLQYEIVVIDDGSTDSTANVVESFIREHPQSRIILHRHASNQGLASSFFEGTTLGTGTYYKEVCGDNTESPEVLRTILRHIGQKDLIIPYYSRVHGKSATRRLGSYLYTITVNLLSGHRLRYYNGLPVYRRADVIRYRSQTRGFEFQAELVIALLNHNRTFMEVPVENFHRDDGRPSAAFQPRNLVFSARFLLKLAIQRFRRSSMDRTSGP